LWQLIDDRGGGQNTDIKGKILDKKTQKSCKAHKTTMPKHKSRIGE